jgi:hypothetical protein
LRIGSDIVSGRSQQVLQRLSRRLEDEIRLFQEHRWVDDVQSGGLEYRTKMRTREPFLWDVLVGDARNFFFLVRNMADAIYAVYLWFL